SGDSLVGSFGAITNEPTPGSVSWSKVDPDGKALAGSEWTLTGPGGFSEAVVDNGAKDEDPAVGALKVSGLVWGEYSLAETKAPVGYELVGEVAQKVTVSGDSLVGSFGAITNEPTPVKPTPTPTPTPVKPTPTPTPAGPGGDDLAKTGSDALLYGGGALALLLAGGAVMSIRRAVRK
ncbi:MAG: prealbumin-like fold domain-containing protein, partial [Actinomyces sp.]|nr:prealbumin-like fold domain-containing protein [Actinomyces sp.]